MNLHLAALFLVELLDIIFPERGCHGGLIVPLARANDVVIDVGLPATTEAQIFLSQPEGRRLTVIASIGVVNISRFVRDMDDMICRAIGEAIEVETVVGEGFGIPSSTHADRKCSP
jgi:hypothetical protein